MAEEIVHHVMALLYPLALPQWEDEPAAKQTRSHRRYGVVNDIDERCASLMQRSVELQVTHGEAVKAHIAAGVDAAYLCDVTEMRLLHLVEIYEYGSRGYKTVGEALHTEALHILHLEVRVQALTCCLLRESPVVHLVKAKLVAKHLSELSAVVALHEHLLRLEIGEHLVYIFLVALVNEILTCGYIYERQSYGGLAEVYGAEEVVFLVVKDIVAYCHTRCHKFCDASFYEFLCQLRVFQLVADGNAASGADKTWQVGIECMVGEARHGIALT